MDPKPTAPTPAVQPWRLHGERDLYDNPWVKPQPWDVEPRGPSGSGITS